MRSRIVAWVLAVAVASPSAASAQESAGAPAAAPLPLSEALQGRAHDAYQAATTLFDNDDWAGAMARYREAYDLAGDPRLLFDMALCARDLHAYGRMQRLLRRYEREAAANMTPEQRAAVDGALAEGSRLVGLVRVEVAERDAAIAVDGEVVGAAPLIDPVAVDIGPHVVAVTKPGFGPESRAIEVAGDGGEVRLDIALVPLAREAHLAVVAPPRRPPWWSITAGWRAGRSTGPWRAARTRSRSPRRQAAPTP